MNPCSCQLIKHVKINRCVNKTITKEQDHPELSNKLSVSLPHHQFEALLTGLKAKIA